MSSPRFPSTHHATRPRDRATDRSRRVRATRRPLAGAVLAVGLAGLLGGCGEGGITLPSGTATVTLPSGTATISLPGNETSTTEAPTDTGTTEPTTQEPETVTETATPTEEPTPEPSPSESASEEAADSTDETDETDEGISPWWFVLLALLVLVGIIWWALARSARRRREQAELLAAFDERGRWVVDHGVGALIGASEPGAVQEAWSRLDATLNDMGGEVSRLAQRGGDVQPVTLHEARDAVSGLKLAAESHARARLGGTTSPATAEALFVARTRLSSALQSLRQPVAD